jgi:FAD/FMN-containing dehydrogenase
VTVREPAVSAAVLAEFRGLAGSLAGSLVLPGDEEYPALRRRFLGRLEELLPQAVVRCAAPGDVAETVTFARARGLPFALRSGGHSFADFGTTDGLLIDLAGMDSVALEGTAVTVGPGTRISVLADRLAAHDRVVPCGWCPTVAVGSVLGGGYGMLGRHYGLGCDQMLAAQVVLADGRIAWVDREREPDLFWALRGAGWGSFAAVTALVLRTYPVPRVTTFVHRCRWRDAVRVIDAWQHWAPDAPDEVNAELVLQAGEPGAEPRVTLFGAVAGRAGDARPLVEDLIARADPDEDLGELTELSARVAARHHTYAGLPVPDRVPPAPPAGQRLRLRAVKSEFFDRPLPLAAVRALAGTFVADPASGQYRELELVPWRGAYRRVSPEATAFVHRTPRFMIGHHGIVPGAATDGERIAVRAWVERSWRTVHPWASGGVYPNYPDRDLAGWARAYYGANLERLMRVKDRYDPDDVFRFAQSVPPTRRS